MRAGKKAQVNQIRFRVDPFAAELIHDYFQHYCERPRRFKGRFGFIYIATAFGTLEVRLDNLLCLTAETLQRLSGKTSQNDQDNVLEITDRTVHASLEVLDRIPDYMAADLVGMVMEAEFELFAMDQQKPVSWGMLRKRLKDPSEEIFRLVILKKLLEGWGTISLEMDDIRTAFRRIVAETGALGKPWKKFLRTHLRAKRKPGRPRNAKYDLLFEKRIINPETETFGKLGHELTRGMSIEPSVARNRLKSAVAYRRKRLSLIRSNKSG